MRDRSSTRFGLVQPRATSSKQIALLLHMARMTRQIAVRVRWQDLDTADRLRAERIVALLRNAADTIQEAVAGNECVRAFAPSNSDDALV